MSTITPLPPVSEVAHLPSVGILSSLYRMNADQYEQFVETGVLGAQPVELIDGLLVRKKGKRPPHVIACEATRDLLFPLIPQGWRLTALCEN